MESEKEFMRFADSLDVPLADDSRTEVFEFTRELEAFIDSYERPSQDVIHRGRQSQDEYNALLDMYPEPRQESMTGTVSDLSIAIKDNIAVEGLRMTFGSKNVSEVPSFDAVVIERLLSEGGTVVGKANMDAFAFGPGGQWSEFGTVQNPLDEERIPGGSSSGSGVAVASGLVDAALGTDTGGSVRSPAACVGIVGIKPTHRLVPRYGMAELAPSTDTIGTLARDVETAARVLDVIKGHDIRDPTASRVQTTSFVEALDDELNHTVGFLDLEQFSVSEIVESHMTSLSDKLDMVEGIEVTDIEFSTESVEKAFSLILGAEFSSLIQQGFIEKGEGSQYSFEMRKIFESISFNSHIGKRLLPGAYLSDATDGESYLIAQNVVREFTEMLHYMFDNVDIIITPTLRSLPPKHGKVNSSKEGLKYTIAKPFSLAKVPGVSVPFATERKLPISAQVIAPEFADRDAIRIAKRIEDFSND